MVSSEDRREFHFGFLLSKSKICHEVDGGQHYEDNIAAQDQQRSSILQSLGIKIISFTNSEVINNFDQVCLAIDEEIKQILSQE